MKASDRNRAILAETVARSWRESDFRQKLTSNPKQTLKDAGMDIPDNHEVEVFENTDNLIYAVLPEISQMDSHNVAFDSAVSRLRNLPENIEVRIMRDSETKSYVVLPMIPAAAASGEMSDAELEQVAGGKVSSVSYEAELQTTTEVAQVETTAEAAAEVAAVALAAIAVVPCFVT